MGNRGVITTRCTDASVSENIGVYLHWNGGRDSVEAFLNYCKLKGYRSPDNDNYGWARLCQVIGNFFGGETSIGIDTCKNLDCDNWDNGVYIIEGWNIVDRQFYKGTEQQNHEMYDMLNEINAAQPKNEQLEQSVIDEFCTQTKSITYVDLSKGKIFSGVKSIKELKSQFKELAKEHHPDNGGDVEKMKMINVEYHKRYKQLRDKER